MNPRGGLSILDALDNLNALVDADTLDEIEVTEHARLIPHKREVEEESEKAYWAPAGADEQTVEAIKETFRCVYDYLQVYCGKMQKTGDTKKLVEGVNTIMVLVGEAAQKLDRFGALFKERVSDFPEYKELQNFYQRKVIPESFREFAKGSVVKEKDEVLSEQQELERELQSLLQEEEAIEEVAGVHILNDLEVIKRDHLYELFYLKNEAGHHFYTTGLARTIKLACDFGVFSEEYFGDDPLLQVKNWEDKQLHLQAVKILEKVKKPLEKFYAGAMKYKEMELVTLVHNACMALLLAANPRNLIRQFSLKGCHLYFFDFLMFMREALHNREYEKLVIYGTPNGKPFFQHTLDLLNAFCHTLFTESMDHDEVKRAIQRLIERVEHKQEKRLSDALAHAHHALTEAFKKHPSGPVFKALDIVREELEQRFDPLMQGNIPAVDWVLQQKGQEMRLLRLACPVVQEWINHAVINEEFKTFLRSCNPEERFLFVNYQDRTSWQEHARSTAIEELSRQAEFASHLKVVTLARDTDFYNQVGVYEALNDAQDFFAQFADHLSDESTGYYFPPDVRQALFPDFIGKLLGLVHTTFFEGKAELSFLERIDCIELVYHFIELKLIELVKPTYVALSSKDGLDSGATSSVGLVALLSLVKGKQLDKEKVLTSLFGPTLMQRERVVHPERFDRLFALVRLLEESGDYLKSFGSLFKSETLNWEVK
ncbi:MAG: hypothetical protein S4CHLAM2_06470 [Chlamydiales bacterium]|nr:hypothetical protein [Chlamydiales bacterium]